MEPCAIIYYTAGKACEINKLRRTIRKQKKIHDRLTRVSITCRPAFNTAVVYRVFHYVRLHHVKTHQIWCYKYYLVEWSARLARKRAFRVRCLLAPLSMMHILLKKKKKKILFTCFMLKKLLLVYILRRLLNNRLQVLLHAMGNIEASRNCDVTLGRHQLQTIRTKSHPSSLRSHGKRLTAFWVGYSKNWLTEANLLFFRIRRKKDLQSNFVALYTPVFTVLNLKFIRKIVNNVIV